MNLKNVLIYFVCCIYIQSPAQDKIKTNTNQRNGPVIKVNPGFEISRFCEMVESKLRDPNGEKDGNGEKPFIYHQMILYGANVLENDSDEVIRQKIQAFWTANHNLFYCTSFRLNLTNAPIGRVGVKREFYSFIEDITEWDVDFNRPDPNDGLTLLQYIKKEQNNTKDLGLKAVLGDYYTMLNESVQRQKKAKGN